MIKPSITNFCKVVLALCLCYAMLDLSGFLNTTSNKYVTIKGNKPADAILFGYVTSSDTNELCMQENWLSGTKYLSSYDEELQSITYSNDGVSYQIKVPLVPEHASVECDTKVQVIQIAAKSPGAAIRYAELEFLISNPAAHRSLPNISGKLYAKSICQSYVSSRTKKWSKYIRCDYFNGNKMIAKKEGNSTTVTLSPDLFKAGTVITYDIIPGENYFPTLERPE